MGARRTDRSSLVRVRVRVGVGVRVRVRVRARVRARARARVWLAHQTAALGQSRWATSWAHQSLPRQMQHGVIERQWDAGQGVGWGVANGRGCTPMFS